MPNNENTKHKRFFVDFRVVVYRLSLGPDAVIPKSVTNTEGVTYDSIFDIDFSRQEHSRYGVIDAINRTAENFRLFLTGYYDAVREKVTESFADGDPFGTKSPFHQVDITPLVTSVSTQIHIEQPNSCIINMVDPQLADMTEKELERFSKFSQSNKFLDNNVTIEKTLSELKNFVFNEFDLVRVFVYTGDDTDSPQEKRESARQVFEADNPDRKDKPVQSEDFLFSPVFTGVASSIVRSNTVDQTGSAQVTCASLSRVFLQSTTVFTPALADVIVQEGDKITGTENKKDIVTANVFSGKSALEVFQTIVKDYLHPDLLGLKESTSTLFNNIETVPKSPIMGVPNLERLTADSSTDASKEGFKKLIPFFPTLVLIHFLKTKYREPIFVYEDRLQSDDTYMADSETWPSSPISTSSTEESRLDTDFTKTLKPYLNMIRSGWELYDSSYMSPYEAFNKIRQSAYMEIIEDRLGTFNFRFPRYNRSTIDHNLTFEDIISVSVERNDSSIFTAGVSKNMADWIGALHPLPGDAFLDRTAIFRYGFRQPQVVENPNAISKKFNTELSRFLRDFTAAKQARTANVVLLGNPGISPGQMVSFKLGQAPRSTSIGSQESSSPDNINLFGGRRARDPSAAPYQTGPALSEQLVGYVISVSDNINVDGSYTQTLGLAFVRPCSIPTRNDKHSSSVLLWDYFANREFSTNAAEQSAQIVLTNGKDGATFGGGSKLLKKVVNAPNLPNYKRWVVTKFPRRWKSTFRAFADSYFLAKVANDPEVIKDYEEFSQSNKGKKEDRFDLSKVQESLAAVEAEILALHGKLSRDIRLARMLKAFSNSIAKKQNLVMSIGYDPKKANKFLKLITTESFLETFTANSVARHMTEYRDNLLSSIAAADAENANAVTTTFEVMRANGSKITVGHAHKSISSLVSRLDGRKVEPAEVSKIIESGKVSFSSVTEASREYSQSGSYGYLLELTNAQDNVSVSGNADLDYSRERDRIKGNFLYYWPESGPTPSVELEKKYEGNAFASRINEILEKAEQAANGAAETLADNVLHNKRLLELYDNRDKFKARIDLFTESNPLTRVKAKLAGSKVVAPRTTILPSVDLPSLPPGPGIFGSTQPRATRGNTQADRANYEPPELPDSVPNLPEP